MKIQGIKAVVRIATFSIGCIAAVSGIAQSGMVLPLEEVGVVRAVDPTRSMITVEKRTLQLTTATEVSADDPRFRYSGVTKALVVITSYSIHYTKLYDHSALILVHHPVSPALI